MGLNQSQMLEADRQLDKNHTEMVVLEKRELALLLAERQQEDLSCIPLQAYSYSQPGLLDGLYGAIQPIYNDSIHQLVNTNWGAPTLLAANDIYDIRFLLQNIGGFGTEIRYSTYKGKEYVILTGRPGLRKVLKGTRYSARNQQLIELGIGRYGIQASAISAFKISCYFSGAIEVLEWIFSDEATIADLFGGIAVELAKAGLSVAIANACAVVMFGSLATAALPIVVFAAVGFIVSVALNVIDSELGIKTSVKAALNYAVENAQKLPERLEQVENDIIEKYNSIISEYSASLAAAKRDLYRYANKQIDRFTDEIIETAKEEASAWIKKKFPSRFTPTTSGLAWPTPPKMPEPFNIKTLKP